ncbi:hypothetical protein CTI12_AA124820 [Artemisia annua]|uniref:Sulfite exporter TauE/SafE family protein n=1 Tax=Artemisia annua TaxID=35608 RepID=A0A2U1PQJ4_ARTAN|nr:hypothetical protein CTI12_AA124820 [Artemisia annua]
MTEIGAYKWRIMRFVMTMVMMSASIYVSSAERNVTVIDEVADESNLNYIVKLANYLFQTNGSGYHHIWPEMEFGWKIVLGSFIGFCGAAFGSVGGVGGGGIFVPMLTLIIGFDPKSATAISKCMIMGAAASTVYYNLKLRHPTLDMPIIDYDLALLIQPMLMLGISIGVAFNVIFADWMVTVLLIILFIGTSTKAFCRGVETWKKETMMKKEAAKRLEGNDGAEAEYKMLPGGPSNGTTTKPERALKEEVTVLENVCWKELGLLVFVWIAFLGLQIAKNYTTNCSVLYWVLNLLQVPVSFGVSGYEAVSLYNGSRHISSKGESSATLTVGQLVLYCSCAAYFLIVATIAAFVGQHVVRKIIMILGRASLIIFILAFTIFVSAISLGGVGISNMITKIQNHEYMGFENLCKYGT